MATKIDIGGELNPRTVEGIVADASTIIDRTAEKRQDEINSEVSESLEGKQGVIADLETIRSGAASGSTAIQPTQIEDVVRHVDTGALEPLLDPSDYATTNQLNQLGQEVNDINRELVESIGAKDSYTVVWGKVINGDGDVVDSATFSYIDDFWDIDKYNANVVVKVNGRSAVTGFRFYDASMSFLGTSYSSSAAYFKLVFIASSGTVEVYDSSTKIYPDGYKKVATEDELSDIETRLEGVESLVRGQSEAQVVLSAYISAGTITANSAWATVYAKVKPNQTATLVSSSTFTVRYAIYSAKPSIGDNSAILVGSMVTGSTSAAIPNNLPYYYIGFSVQEDKINLNPFYIDAELWESENIDERVTNIETELSDFDNLLPKLNYGQLLLEKCPNFVRAMREKKKDVTVCLTGTSLTQGNLYASLIADRLNRPPLMQANDLCSAVFDSLVKLWPGQKYYRFDNPSVTRSTSTWTDSATNTIWDDSGSSKNGYTGRTKSANAYIRCTVPSNAWRFNFIYRTDTEGGTCTVTISEGNNKMEVFNGTSWVEANGYTFSMLESAATATKGNTCFQKRLNMRCKNKASGGINSIGTTKTITISKGNDSTTSFNVVGFEWSPREYMLTVINGARGGHCWGYQTEILVPEENNLGKYQDTDIWEFNPDLILCEVTAINWAAGSQRAIAYDPNWFVNLAKRYYYNEFNDTAISLYAKSNGYTDCEVVFYGDTLSVVSTNANVWDSAGNPVFGTVTDAASNGNTDTSNVGRVKTAIENYDAVDDYMLSKDELFIPVTQKIIEFAKQNYGTYKAAFTESGATGDTLSYDGTHLNDKGVKLWASYILPLFNF